ncbi:MAG TPA: adenylate/guanylate cyclase domain-containing protein [Candidatus Wallbacteria bacterium]|nr:adenylate/guanylate cyclase domain-containing protein [Candidatus Wallbacteria bacterium]
MSLDRIKKILMLFAFFAAAAAFAAAGREELAYGPADRSFHFRSPYWAISDDSGSVLLVDSECRRLSLMSSAGEVRWTKPGGRRSYGEVFEYYDTKFDSRGNIYVINALKEFGYNRYSRMEVLKYSPAGRFVKKIASHDKCDFGSFLNIRDASGGSLFYTCAGRDSEEMQITKIDCASNSAKPFIKIALKTTDFRMAAGTFPGEIFVSTSFGRIASVADDGSLKPYLDSPPAPFVDQIWADSNGGLYFNSFDDMNIYKASAGTARRGFLFSAGCASCEVFLSFAKIKKAAGADSYFFKWISINGRDEITAVNLADGKIVSINPDGSPAVLISSGIYSTGLFAFHIAVWCSMAGAVLVFAYFMARFYYTVFKKNTSIIIQNIAVFTPILVLSIYFTAAVIYNFIYPNYEEEIRLKLLTIAQAAGAVVDGGLVSKINSRACENSKDFERLSVQLKSIINENKDPWNAKLSVIAFKKRNGILHVACDPSGNYMAMEPYPYAIRAHHEAIESSKVSGGKFSDPDAEYMAAAAPLKNGAGETTGALGVAVDYNIIRELDGFFIARVARGIVMALIANFALLIMISYFLFISLRAMQGTVKKITGGDFDAQMPAGREDELGELGAGINFMTKSLKEYISKIVKLNESYYRFVPRNFLELLKIESAVKIKLGDNVSREMAVLFSDIMGFSAMSEKLSPQENFNFINSYLAAMGPVIRENGGFIDKYIGGIIMALFEKPSSAMKCALAMAARLDEFNEARRRQGGEPISTGVGIHYGDLMLGIVGEHERISATVISDTVNLSSRLEGLCKHYGAAIIASGSIVENCETVKFDSRPLGRVLVKGKTEPADIVEIIIPAADGCSSVKSETKELFALAVKKYCAADIASAIEDFKEISTKNPSDGAAAIFVKKCEELIKTGIPKDFSGVDKLSEK